MKFQNVFAVGDLHFPITDKIALRTVIKQIKNEQPDVVVQMGDLFDRYAGSKFPRSLNIWTPQHEEMLSVSLAEKFWQDVQAAAPRATCYQLMGNHDIRPLKKVIEKSPEFEHVAQGYLQEIYTFPGVHTVYDPREELIINNDFYMHGYLTKPGAHVRKNLNRNIIVGHSHYGYVLPLSIEGKVLWELNVGYLGDRHHKCLSYTAQKRMTNWTLGSGRVDELGPRFVPIDEK